MMHDAMGAHNTEATESKGVQCVAFSVPVSTSSVGTVSCVCVCVSLVCLWKQYGGTAFYHSLQQREEQILHSHLTMYVHTQV